MAQPTGYLPALLARLMRGASTAGIRRAGAELAVSAHILLRELREVARALPTGLDEASLGARMLSDVRSKTDLTERSSTPTATATDLPLDRDGLGQSSVGRGKENPLVHQVVHTRTLAVANGSFTDSAVGSRAILPLRFGDQLIGVVAMERSAGSWTAAELDNAQSTIDEAAVHLDSGRLFSEARALATMEERRRLA